MSSTPLPTLSHTRSTKHASAATRVKGAFGQPPAKSGDAQSNGVPVTQSICFELLVGGQIHSFIDFFNIVNPTASALTSATPSSTASPKGSIPAGYSLEDLQTLKSLLTTCELSVRSGDQSQVYAAKKALGFFYQRLPQVSGFLETSAGYLREAFECAKVIHGKKFYEIEAAHNLGLVLASMGQAHEAVKMYEHSRNLAADKGDAQAEQLASKSLVGARILIAQQLERDGQFKEAISHYAQSIQIIEKSKPDEKVVNDLHYCLGNAFKQDNQIITAVEYLDKYLEKCKDLNDHQAAGRAQLALATCYESSGNLEEATDYLKQFIEATESDPNQKTSLAQACNQIGILYNKIGDFDQAVTYFDRHFALACEINKEQLSQAAAAPVALAADAEKDQQFMPPAAPLAKSLSVGSAQIQVGLSKANANMRQFFEYVVEGRKDLKGEKFVGLLKWKAMRAFEGNATPGPPSSVILAVQNPQGLPRRYSMMV
ncbi:hypothetical protein BC830DRAFT_1131013 [Chytriomyces sp. MP71]|nr:hypothetical protein BC830DRAFT_1131013 [Chytriomyces sp. MP71]